MNQIIDTMTGTVLTHTGGPWYIDIHGQTWQKISTNTILNVMTGDVHPCVKCG